MWFRLDAGATADEVVVAPLMSASGTTRKSRDVRFRAAVSGIADIIRALIRGAPNYEHVGRISAA